jgi:hypothetical protein
VGHQVATAYELGWSQLQNGALLNAAEQDGFEILITTDQQLRYQQNLSGRQIAIVVLLSTDWLRIKVRAADIRQVLDSLTSGSYVEVPI